MRTHRQSVFGNCEPAVRAFPVGCRDFVDDFVRPFADRLERSDSIGRIRPFVRRSHCEAREFGYERFLAVLNQRLESLVWESGRVRSGTSDQSERFGAASANVRTLVLETGREGVDVV